MPEKNNILTREIVLEPKKLENSGLSIIKSEFLLKTLLETFGVVYQPEDEDFADKSKIHPIVWMLMDYSGKDLPKLFQLCLEISIIKNIPNSEYILQRIIDANEFVGVRAEVYFGARIRSATNKVSFIKELKGNKTPDFEIKTENENFYIEVKGSDATDFEIGIDMFNGWVRNRLNDLFPKDNLQRIIHFDASWIGAIAAACNIKTKVENASWAFHSAIMSLVDVAAQLVRSNSSKNNVNLSKDELGIEIFTNEKKSKSEPSVVIELPQSKRIAAIGNIIQKLTSNENFQKFKNGNGVFAFLTRYAVNKTVSESLLNTILIQCPELRNSLLGLAIFSSEYDSPFYIHSPESYDNKPWFPNYFKEPIWDENAGNAIIPY
jgi:hypothetical protein